MPNLIMLLIILCGRRKRWDTLLIKTRSLLCYLQISTASKQTFCTILVCCFVWKWCSNQDKTEFLESSTKPFVLLLRPASQIASTLSHLLSLLFGKSLLTSNFSYLNIHLYTFLQSLKEHLTFSAWHAYLSWWPLCNCDTLENLCWNLSCIQKN